MSTAAAKELCVKLNMEASHPTIGNRENSAEFGVFLHFLPETRKKKENKLESKILRGCEPCTMIPVFYSVGCKEWIAVDEAGPVLK